MEILSYFLWVILAIMILVFVHEMGHFLFAKLFKMRVDRFSVGFPPKIIGKTIGETEYVLGATPLGGYVKIAGMIDESMDTDYVESEPQPWEYRAKPVWQRMIVITAGVIFNILLAFVIFTGLKLAYGEDYIPAENVKSVYVQPGSVAYKMGMRTGDRVVAVSGKPIERYDEIESLESLLSDPMTISVVRSADTLTLTAPRDLMTQLNRSGGQLGISAAPPLVGSVASGSAAAQAGLQTGDRIVAIGNQPVRFWEEMVAAIQKNGGRRVVIRWERPDSLATGATQPGATVPVPTMQPDSTAAGDTTMVAAPAGHRIYQAVIAPKHDRESGRYLLGVSAVSNADPALWKAIMQKEFGIRHHEYTLVSAATEGAQDTWLNASAIVTSLKRMITGRENVRENLGGPIMIAKVTKAAADAGWRFFWGIVATLSVTLAVMNILPIPALDGGHLVFLIYEAIARREPSLKVRMALQQVGMVLLLVLMTFLIFNDILKL